MNRAILSKSFTVNDITVYYYKSLLTQERIEELESKNDKIVWILGGLGQRKNIMRIFEENKIYTHFIHKVDINKFHKTKSIIFLDNGDEYLYRIDQNVYNENGYYTVRWHQEEVMFFIINSQGNQSIASVLQRTSRKFQIKTTSHLRYILYKVI